MAIFEVGAAATATLNIGLVLLIVPVLAEFAKMRKGSERAYNWIATGGISFLLASAFGASGALSTYSAGLASAGWLLFDAIGLLLVLIGALMVLFNSLNAK